MTEPLSDRRELEIDGLRIAYEQAGDGPLLVLLHGYVGDGPSTGHPQLDAPSDAFTVVAWDGPGTGRSSDPPESFSLPDFADVLAGFVDALELGRPHVAGLSFGGGLALELVRRHPGIPRTLILASAYTGWAGSLSPEEGRLRLRQVLELADLPPERFVAAVAPTASARRCVPSCERIDDDMLATAEQDGLCRTGS
jgi:pimeloyl-ACP methyl ester carboxylesterase